MRKPARWLLNIAISLDQACNALIGGDPDETLSSVLGKAERGDFGERCRRRTAWLRALVDWTFRALGDGPDHCARSIEDDEGRRRL